MFYRGLKFYHVFEWAEVSQRVSFAIGEGGGGVHILHKAAENKQLVNLGGQHGSAVVSIVTSWQGSGFKSGD